MERAKIDEETIKRRLLEETAAKEEGINRAKETAARLAEEESLQRSRI